MHHLRSRPLFHVAERHALVHAGLLPGWSVEQARSLAAEVEFALQGPRYRALLEHMYGDMGEVVVSSVEHIESLAELVDTHSYDAEEWE